METAGLREISAMAYDINTQEVEKGLVQRYGRRGLLGVTSRMLLLYVKSPAYRKFVKGV